MSCDYKQITEDNIRRRGEEFDDIGQWISEQFYSDRTHFIYELLQNAEDALRRRFHNDPDSKIPCKVQFNLISDRLEFSHFGQPFNEDDVRGISDILKGTKRDDINQIGKFGIGFKSVYAFTSMPEIYSGDEHFIIERYIRPRETCKITKIQDQETLFILPFNHAQMKAEDSYRLIYNRLNKIGVRTLLFLRHINEIEWLVDNKIQGMYLTDINPMGNARRVTVIGRNNEKEESEEWLIFEKSVQSPEINDPVTVEIAFLIVKDDKSAQYKIIRSKSSPIVVFFPTEQETRFGFLAQGPFKTTPARDNVLRDSDWNKFLINEIANLLKESLSELKSMGLLKVNVLEALPIRNDDFPMEGMYRPVFDSVKETLSKFPLLPTDRGKFVNAVCAKLARGGDLRKLLSTSQLKSLFQVGDDLHWLSGDITENQTPDLWKYLSQELGIEVIDPDSFARKLSLSFLQNQTDDWIIAFYDYLLGVEALWRQPKYSWESGGPLRNKEIVRKEDGSQVKPFKSDGNPNVFLPPAGNSKYQVVKESIASNEKAHEFLKKLGIREVGDREYVETVLKSYYVKDAPDPNMDDHLKHIEKFVAWFQKGGDKKIFDGFFIFRDVDDQNYYTADSCFLDSPFIDTGLHYIYETDPQQEALKFALYEKYLSINGFEDFAKCLGVVDRLVILEKKIADHPDKDSLKADYHKGARITYTGCDKDYSVDIIDNLLDRKNVNVSRIIWDTIRNADPAVLTAKFCPNQTYPVRTAPSTLVYKLREHDWIPDSKGKFHLPAKIDRHLLPGDFAYDDRNGWLRAIEFGKETDVMKSEQEIKESHARALGISNPETVDMIKEIDSDDELRSEIRQMIDRKNSKPIFPTRSMHNPERRENKMSEEIENSPEKTYGRREGSVRVSQPPKRDRETYLRQSYTNDEGQLVCQICKNEMPFKRRDGEYYFEAVEILSDQDIEHESLYLALCPLCAAKYKEFIKRDTVAMSKLKELLIKAEAPTINVNLDKVQTDIGFVETHLSDIKTILRAERG